MHQLQNLHWASLSVIALLCLIPVMMMYPATQKAFGSSVPVIFLWYGFSFITWTILFCFNSGTVSSNNFIPNTWVIIITCVVGAFGVLGTFALFTAATKAPNPGLPFAMANGAAAAAYLLSALMAQILPKTFPPSKIDVQSMIGILLTIVGLALIALRK